MAAKKKTKRRPRKQTSERVSSIAARVLRAVRSKRPSLIWAGDIAALAASCLAQDEVKGKRAGR